MCTDVHRLVRLSAHGLGREVRAVRLGEYPVRRELGRRLAKRLAFGYVTFPANET